MSTDSHSSRPPAASQGDDLLWEQVAGLVDEFAAAWEAHVASGEVQPTLKGYLPSDEQLATLALPELIKTDLEYRWQHGRSPSIVLDFE